MLKNICIIGAGNIGSRHLQALKKVSKPLLIQVIDPSLDSLKLAKQRYEEVQISKNIHQIHFLQDLKNISKEIDIAIIATSSNIRSHMTQQLLNKSSVKYIIFEKLLFQKRQDYISIQKLLDKKGCKAWVNCSMRTNPFYFNLKKQFKNQEFSYSVSGSCFGLITSAIHYIDHIAFLTDCYDYTVDTSYLNKTPIESKRKGFLELTGTLNVHFSNGSFGSFTCYPVGDAPFIIQIFSDKYRCSILETENKLFFSSSHSAWKWVSKKIPILFQSQMTNIVVSALSKSCSCQLTSFEQSSKLHLNLLEPLLKFLNKHSGKRYDKYPFT